MFDGESISAVARRPRVVANHLYRSRQLILEGGCIVVAEDDGATANKAVRERRNRTRELERRLGRRAMEVEILKETLDKSRSKKRPCLRSRNKGGICHESWC